MIEEGGRRSVQPQPARGAVFLMLAQGVILASGFGVSIILGRGLGPEMFGAYGVVLAVLTLFERALSAGIPRAAAGMIAREQGRREDLEQSARVLMLLWGAALAVILWLAAPALAVYFDTEPAFVRILALNIPAMAVFLAYDAILSARRHFGVQSLLQTIQSFVKLIGILFLLMIGLSVSGALVAHVIGTVVVAGIALALFPPGLRVPPAGLMQSIVRDAFTTGFYTVALGLLLSLGLWQLDALGPQEGLVVGLYVASQNVTRMLLIVPASLSGVLFSSAAWATGASQEHMLRKYVQETLRLGMILMFPACLLVAIDAEGIIRLLYGDKYVGGGAVLAALCTGYAAMGFLDMLAHVLMAEGRYRFSAVLASMLVPALFALNAVLIPSWKGVGAATSMIAVFTVGIAIASFQVRKRLGSVVQGGSVVRIVAACLLVGAISAYVPAASYWLCIKLALLGALYLGLLWGFRELSAADLAVFLKAKRK